MEIGFDEPPDNDKWAEMMRDASEEQAIALRRHALQSLVSDARWGFKLTISELILME
jgi:hypothetical protein